MVPLVVLALLHYRLQSFWEWMSMGRQVQTLVYRSSKNRVAMPSITVNKVTLINWKNIRLVSFISPSFVGLVIHGTEPLVTRTTGSWITESKWWKPSKFDVIIEMRADLNLQHDMEMMEKKGRLVVVGALGEVQINPRLLMGPEFQIRAVGCYGFTACSNFESKDRIRIAL